MKRIMMLGLLTLSTAALAQQDDDKAPIEYREVTELSEDDFTGLNVDGELVKPRGAVFFDVKREGFHPMITLRTDFNAEMSDSVNDVR
ncbi:MAG: hypothetical protein AAFV53_06405 [Myxococcota bacterium]